MTPAQRWDLSTTYARRGLISVAAAPANQVCLDARGGGCACRPLHGALVPARDGRATADPHQRTLPRHAWATSPDGGVRGDSSQLWRATPSGELVNGANGQCLTDPHDSLASGTRLRTCPTASAHPGRYGAYREESRV